MMRFGQRLLQRRRRTLRPMMLLFAIMGACVPATAAPVKVVASFSILADIIHEIGGDRVSVTTLVGPNGDAHAYQPTASDARSLIAADLIVVNGLGFEPWFDRLRASTATSAPVVIASAGLAAESLIAHGAIVDPHAWQDLRNGLSYVDTIATALAARDPADSAFFQHNAALYRDRLAALDRWVRDTIAAIPRSRRRFITSHDAFAYFGRAYGLDILAAVGISGDAEPTAQGVAALIRQMRAENVRAVFFENMLDRRLVRQIADDGGGVAGGTLYADALSPPDGPAGSYTAMFVHNVATVQAALSGAGG